jgi:hypothetical protein
MDTLPKVPMWLLEDFFLSDGVFTDETRTAVTGHLNAHMKAVSDTGNGPRQETTRRLNEDQIRRLANETGR